MVVVGHPSHGFVPLSALFFAHVFAAALPAVLLWYLLPFELLSIAVFVGVAFLLTPPLLPWYRRLHPQPSSED